MAKRFQVSLGLLLLVAMIFMMAQGVLAESNPSDVPSSHWAYKAVKQLVDKGYLQLYQDQTFQGDKPVDRYTLAIVVSKVLNEIANGQVLTNKDDMDLLKRLFNEFQAELVSGNSKNNLILRKLDQVTKDNQIIKEDLTNTMANLQKLNGDQLEYQKQARLEAQQMLAELDRLKARVQALEAENQRLRADLDQLRNDAEQTKKRQGTWLVVAIVLGLLGAAN